MYNRYKELKIMKANEERILSLVNEVSELVQQAKTLIDEKTNIEEEISELLSKADDTQLVTVNILKVDSPLNDLNPPCLPFDLAFVLHTATPIAYIGTQKSYICFNGEFFTNVAIEIMKKAYPIIDDMYKALDSAELRYVSIIKL